jgi:hypothetical protein
MRRDQISASILDSMVSQESAVVGTQVLSPVFANTKKVNTRISNIVVMLTAEAVPRKVRKGPIFGCFEVKSMTTAQFIREGTDLELAAYVQRLPQTRLILVERKNGVWIAAPAFSTAQSTVVTLDQKARVPVLFGADTLERFDTVEAGFDGRMFLYAGNSVLQTPQLPSRLRFEVARADSLVPASKLILNGLTEDYRSVYEQVTNDLVKKRVETTEDKLRKNVQHGGGTFISYTEQQDTFVVTYEVAGVSHRSTVRQNDLGVVSSGVCLSGRDRDFDLSSLVTVMKERSQRGIRYDGDPGHGRDGYDD